MRICEECNKQPALTKKPLCSQCFADTTCILTDDQRVWINLHFCAVARHDDIPDEDGFKLLALAWKVRHGRSLTMEDREFAEPYVNSLLIAHDRLYYKPDITGETVYRKLTGLDRNTQSKPPFPDLHEREF